jgi:hypothetical protein
LRHRIAFLLIAFLCINALAQTDNRLMLGGFDEKAWGLTLDRPLYQAQSDVQGSNNTAQIFFWDSTGRFRLDANSEDSLHIGYRWVTLSLDTDSPVLPDHLDEISLAGGIPLGTIGDWRMSTVLGAGFSGNNPFADSEGVFGIAHLIAQKKLSESDDLVLSVDWNGVSAFLPDVPLPGFQYIHHTDTYRLAFGYPRSEANWTLFENFTLEAGYEVPYTADVTLDYAITKRWHLYSGFSNFFNGYRQDNRPQTQRLFFQMSRVEAGIRFVQSDFVLKGAYFDMALAIGYAFEQHFYDGFDVRDLSTRADLQDVPYVGLVIRGQF